MTVPGNPEIKSLPTGSTFLRILGVNYIHLKTADGGDLYLTEHGLPFLQQLRPENWYADARFRKQGQRLEGTGTVYRVGTRPLPECRPASIEIVVKWSRVGQDVPLDTFTATRAMQMEFNSPFEEFSLVEELRAGRFGPPARRILTQRPLAIYVPPENLQLWQTGRSRAKIRAKVRRHASVEIDVLRSYILIFGWIKGMDAVVAYHHSIYERHQQQTALEELTREVDRQLQAKGFLVADHKPAHLIVRLRNGTLRHRRDRTIPCAVIDYELLARTPEHDTAVKAQGRGQYLALQHNRFSAAALREPVPSHLHRATVLGVPYIYGRAESTSGRLWVVGQHPELFSYFLPERWRRKQVRLSESRQTYYTHTKDGIHLVWKVCPVGELPPGDVSDPIVMQRIRYGFNSPFEEFALALAMASRGLKVIYPRAIYVTMRQSDAPGFVMDDRRFERMSVLRSPDGDPLLSPEPDYITIWGYFRGQEDDEAVRSTITWSPLGLPQAAGKGLIAAADVPVLLERHRRALADAGFEDLGLKPSHILLSYIPGGTVKRDPTDTIELRHCNFELVKRV